jgi:hypothetical protein
VPERPSGAAAGAQLLQSTFDLLDRVAQVGGTRERLALSLRLDDWLTYDAVIALPGGGAYPEHGFDAEGRPDARLYLLPGGNVLTVPADPAAPPTVLPLIDADLDLNQLAGRLRTAAVLHFLGGIPLAVQSGPLVPRTVAELLMVAERSGAPGRASILRMLADAMRPADGWNEAAARLKAGFEHGLGDRAPAVRAVSATGLVRMAAGLGPVPPGNPLRSLNVLFTVPHADVHAAALAELRNLPQPAFEPVVPTITPLVQAAMAAPDPEVRRLAGDVQLRIGGGGGADALAADLDAGGTRRLAALGQLAGTRDQPLDAFLPKVLDATEDSDARIREAALAVLAARLDGEPLAARRRILISLLGNTDPRLVHTAIDVIAVHAAAGAADPLDPRGDPELVTHIRAALDGPEDSRAAAARLWLHLHDAASVEETAGASETLLRHTDPVVRQAALRHLAEQPAEGIRVPVREALLRLLVERLRDPEPSLRLEAARAILGQRYPSAGSIVGQLALEADPGVRHAILGLLRRADDPAALESATRTAGRVDTLFAGLDDADLSDTGASRGSWAGALEGIAALSSTWVIDLLIALLREIPAEAADPWRREAIAAIDAVLARRVEADGDLLLICRRLIEPPQPAPAHAARLAGTGAAQDPRALDFLWLLYRGTRGPGSEAARRVLAELVPLPKAPAVEAEIMRLRSEIDDPADKTLLARLLGYPG